MTERIKVALRCRPVDLLDNAPVLYQGNSILVKKRLYKFDYIFPSSSNKEVYNTVVAPNMDDLFNGKNITIMAYGATGSGKTHTMGTSVDGTKDSGDGIIQLSVQDIYERIQRDSDPSAYSIKVSFIEIYGDEIFDLINNNAKLSGTIRKYSNGFKVPDVQILDANTPAKILEAFKKGCSNRKTCATAKNDRSSRSHAIFTIILEKIENKTLVKNSRFVLVDLAGSERIGASCTKGTSLKEGININKGLLILRQVIYALAYAKDHVPFRDSKLTKILQDALDGSSKTSIIACIHPRPENLSEVINTLQYASLANTILVRPTENSLSADIENQNLKKLVEELQKVLQGYQNKLSQSEASAENDIFYKKFISSESALTKLREKSEHISNSLGVIYELLKNLKGNIECKISQEGQGEEDTKQILDNLFGALVDLMTNESTLETSDSNVEKEVPYSEEQAVLAEEVREISQQMSSNERIVEQLESEKGEGVDLDMLSCLNAEIARLTKEKNSLEEILLATADGQKAKAQKDKIDKLMNEINRLKVDLKDKATIHKQNKINEAEIMKLKTENDNLKLMKSNLQKKMKDTSTTMLNLSFERKKEITQFIKDSKQKDAEKARVVTKLQKEIVDLQKKVDRLSRENISRGPASQIFRNSSKDSIETNIKEAFDGILKKKFAELLKKKAEQKFQVLSNINNIDESDFRNTLQTEEIEETDRKIAAAKLCATTAIEKMSCDIKDSEKETTHAIEDVLRSVSSITEGKLAISVLIKQFLDVYEKLYWEEDERCSVLENKVTNLEQKDVENELSSRNIIQELRKSENTNKELVEQVKHLSLRLEAIENISGDSQMLEKVRLQESIIAELRRALDDCQTKDKALQSLSKDIFHAKKGKSTPWLGQVPRSIPNTQEESDTLVDEFLDETLEISFLDDLNDPDWRGTPLYKRNKEKMARKLPSFEDDSPPKKKPLHSGGCSCSGGCKTMRCHCRKVKADCSIVCDCRGSCSNCPTSSNCTK